MKINLFTIFTLAAMLLSSCAVEEIPTEGGSIIAEMENEQTRTTVTDEGSFTWSAGDQIWLHTTAGSVAGTLSSGAGTPNAEFSFGTYFGDMTGKAIYPYNSKHSISGDQLNMVMPASYDLGASLSNTNAAMYGVNIGGKLKFNHLAGVMRFSFRSVPAGVDRFTITLDKKINGTFTADLTAEYPTIEASATDIEAEKTITLNFNPLTEASDIKLYIPLPIGTYTTLELGLYKGEESVWSYSNTVTNTIKRKSLKLMPVINFGGSIGGDIDGEVSYEVVQTLIKRLNSNIEALQTIAKVLKENDYVTTVTCIEDNGQEIGHKLTFKNNGQVAIYTYLNGVTPQLKISEGYWHASFNGGVIWHELSKASTESPQEPIFSNASYDNKQVRLTLADGSELAIPIGRNDKIVDLFIFMGQSNMVGRGVAADAPIVPEGWGYEYKAISDPGKLNRIVEPFGLDEENSQSGVVDNRRSGSMVSALVNAYYEKSQVPVVGVSCSKGGTTTSFWKPGGKPLNDAISRYNEAEQWLEANGYTIRNKYMFWLQGETDATNGLAAETYKTNMVGIVKEMLSKTTLEKCMMIRVGKLGQTVSSAFTICDDIIEVQTELCQTYKEFVMASTAAAGFVKDGLMAEYWHYTQEGYNLLGEHVGLNVAYYATNGIEPYMYDPHYDNLYYPSATKHQSVFDYNSNDDENLPDYDFSNTTWYIDHTRNGAKFTSSCNIAGRGWAISYNNDLYDNMVGKPINTAAFFTNKKSQSVTVMKLPYKGATSGEVIATVTATIASASKSLAVINFPEVTLAQGELLSLFSQEDDDIQFYYSTSGVNDSASGALDKNFYSRLPILYGSGTSWSEAAMSLGWSFGYTAMPSVSKLACIGDSVTYGVGASDKSCRYSTLLAGLLDAEEINLGVSGTSLCTDGPRTCNFSKLTAEKLAGADLVTIKMGINDWAAAKTDCYNLGVLGSDDTSTIYGATAMWCEKITELKATEQYKDTRFYFITPLVTSCNNSVTSVKDYNQSKTNIHGFTLRDLCEAIIKTCAVYDIPVLDMNKDSGIYYNSPEDDHASAYFGDGVHPNDAGHAKLAQSIYHALTTDILQDFINRR